MTGLVVQRLSLRNILTAAVCMLSFVTVTGPGVWAQRFPGRVGGGVPRVAPPAQAPVGPAARPAFFPAPQVGRFPPGTFHFHGGPLRPFPGFPFYSFFGGPCIYRLSWHWSLCWWCDLYWMWGWNYSMVPFYQYGNFVAPQYPYIYAGPPVYGEGRPELPQLYLRDGRVYNVTDYWLVDGELHFTMRENERLVEQVIDFDELDVRRTADMATERGFLFVLRDEPVEQYLQHHPDFK